MKKKIAIMVVYMMLVTSFLVTFPIENVEAAGNTLDVGGNESESHSSIQEIIDDVETDETEMYNNYQSQNFTKHEKSADVVFPELEMEEKGKYLNLRMSGCYHISNPGHPCLPIKSIVFKLPLSSSVSKVEVVIKDTSSIILTKQVLPSPTPISSLCEDKSHQEFQSSDPFDSLQPNSSIYNSNELYPKDWFSYSLKKGLEPEINKRILYVIVWIYPVRYLPISNEIILAEEASVNVFYEDSTSVHSATSSLRNLIITSPILENQAVRLCTFKNSIGISSRVVNTSWIYQNYIGDDHQEQIRNCIKDFVSQYGILYVSIFGDADRVPVRYAYIPDGYETYVATDLYYADLDGTWDDNEDGLYADLRYDIIDGVPDVYVGRIPPSSLEYAETAVDKIIAFTNNFDGKDEWANRVVLAAGTGDNGGGSNSGTANAFLNDYIADMISNLSIEKLYESDGGLTTDILKSEINSGCLFLNFAGHGSPNSWLLRWIIYIIWPEHFSTSDAQSLTNGVKLPVVTTKSCSTARFDDQDCLGEWFVLNSDGGSVAYFGATRIAWGYTNEDVIGGLMGEMNWRVYEAFEDEYTELGKIWGTSVFRYIQCHPLDNYFQAGYLHEKTVMEFVLLGDPTINIAPRPTFVYVDDDYNETTPGWSYNHFDTIQTGINVIAENGTIFVYNGTYYENIAIHKTINLIGEDRDTTIIDGNESQIDIVVIYADWVNLSGFTICNNTYTTFIGEAIATTSNHNTITGNTIQDIYGTGITLYPLFDTSNNTISGNIITNCTRNGISIGGYGNHVISDNNITYNGYNGILISSVNNTIFGNNIANNGDYGIYVQDICNNNYIYHNSLINNTVNAYDECTNIWDDGYPSGGNYWNDYTGIDADGDGIGDIPYDIPGGDNQDNYPLGYFNKPPTANFYYLPINPTVLEIVTFTDTSTDTDGSTVSWYWDFGDDNTSTVQNPTHQYGDDGTYTVSLTVTDDGGKTDDHEDDITVINTPPTAYIDSIYPNPALYGESVFFNGHGTDPDGTIVAWRWDSSIDGLLNTQPLFDTSTLSLGTHTIYFKVKDDDNEWSQNATQILIINDPPIANFTYEPLYPTTQDIIYFNSTSYDPDGSIVIWTWSFGDGNVSYDGNTIHQYEDDGTYTVILNVTDDDGAANETTQQIVVANVAPVANDDCYSVAENGTLYISAPGVLENDTDAEGDSLSASLISNVSNGVLTLFDNGSFGYNPTVGYNGTDSFTYKAFDGIDYSNEATVTIWVISNNPPYNPSNSSPSDGKTNVDINKILSWSGGDPDSGDTVTYDVFFGTSNPPSKISSNQSGTNYDPGTMSYNTKCYWKIIAWDKNDTSAEGPIWSFTTEKESTQPPYNPPYNPPPTNQDPIANASASETLGFINTPVIFDGSLSSDEDGSITNYTWNFGDETTGYGDVTTHTYVNPGEYIVTLTVTDNEGATDDDTITVVISKPNIPPTAPEIDGASSGAQNTDYIYTAVSTDADNDTIQYLFDWGDDETTTTDFLPNGTATTQTHSWATAGEYTISVKVYDNETESGTAKYTVLIDVWLIDDEIKGYLVDEDSDGKYDLFDSSETGEKITVEKQDDGTYLIDIDGDGSWDYTFSMAEGLSVYQEKENTGTPGFEFIILMCAIAAFLSLKRKRKA